MVSWWRGASSFIYDKSAGSLCRGGYHDTNCQMNRRNAFIGSNRFRISDSVESALSHPHSLLLSLLLALSLFMSLSLSLSLSCSRSLALALCLSHSLSLPLSTDGSAGGAAERRVNPARRARPRLPRPDGGLQTFHQYRIACTQLT